MGGGGSKDKRKKKYAGDNCRAAPNPDKFNPGTGEDTGVKIGKQVIDFNFEGAGAKGIIPLDTPIFDSLEIKNNNSYSVKFSFDPCFQREFQLTFSPANGTIKSGTAKIIRIKLNVHIKVNVNFRVNLNIEGVGSHFIIAKIRCETGVFGVDPDRLPCKPDEAGRPVPEVLHLLKSAFLERHGLEQEGVFRLAGDQNILKETKRAMNSGNMTMPDDVNLVATLIKIWYRELPEPVLNALSGEKIFYSSEVQDCVDSVATLPEAKRALLDWLLDLLLLVAENRRVNKMTAQNLAIVVAPNLYEATTPDPMEGLVMSQKAVQFIHNVLIHKIRERERQLGRAIDAEFGQDELAAQPFNKDGSMAPRPAPAASHAAPAAIVENSVSPDTSDAEKQDSSEPRRKRHRHGHKAKKSEDASAQDS
eukprot:m51a1_g424 hypothetical protein (419) ;mRNA; f:24241-26339